MFEVWPSPATWTLPWVLNGIELSMLKIVQGEPLA